MSEEKNVLLTVIQRDNDEDDAFAIDFSLIWRNVKRLFIIWLCFALGLGALTVSGGLLLKRVNQLNDTVKALVSFPTSDYDIRKIKSPKVMEDAMNQLGLDLEQMEDFRGALSIEGVISNSAYDKLSMYYNLASKDASLATIDSLLNTGYQVSMYVISFQYTDIGLTQQRGADFLNALLRAYQDYCVFTYRSNTALGNPLSAVDYRDYDYAEAVDIFTNALSNVTSYVSNLEGSSFRSTESGYTFQDLHRMASLLQEIDLDRLAAYIIIHSVSIYDAETEIAYYNWRIEDLTRRRNIQRTKLASLTDSINSYEKDPIIFAARGDAAVVTDGNVNANYDSMIREKLETERAISGYTRSISFYESVIDGFRQAEESSDPKSVEKVTADLSAFNEKITDLVNAVSVTANEYYDRSELNNWVQIRVPAAVSTSSGQNRVIILVFIVAEAVMLLAYFFVCLYRGLREANPPKKREEAFPAETKSRAG